MTTIRFVEQEYEIKGIFNVDGINSAARDCYRSTPENAKKTPEQFRAMLIKNKHTAMVEFGVMHVRLITDIGVGREILRHRPITAAQQSTRFVDFNKDGSLDFIRPLSLTETQRVILYAPIVSSIFYRNTGRLDVLMSNKYGHEPGATFLADTEEQKRKNAILHTYIQGSLSTSDVYHTLREYNLPPEEARDKLTLDLATVINIQANFTEWRHIFNLRVLGTSGRPHPRAKALLSPLLFEMGEKYPEIFGDQLHSLSETINVEEIHYGNK